MTDDQITATSNRLVIQRLELENFKSYGGKRVLGPFHPRFSCIVGSNGSGKSNIVDAMLFVFGKRAQQLRMRRLQDLIHNSGAMPNCKYCRVVVWFCDVSYSSDADHRSASAFSVVPNSTFSVGREAYMEGGSKYLLDGVQVAREKIVSLLQSKGVDLDHNRFLILQGEVEQIALLKPIGRRNDKGEVVEGGLLEFIDDIIGTNKYIDPIRDLTSALDESNQQLTTSKNLMEISWTKLSELIPSVTESKAACNLELERLRWTLLRVRGQELVLHREMLDLTQKQTDIKNAWSAYKAETAGIQEEEERVENELIDATKIKKKAEKAYDKLNEKFNVIEDREMELAMKIKKGKLERDKITDKIANYMKDSTQGKNRIAKLEKSIGSAKVQEVELQKEYDGAKDEYDQFLEEQKGNLSVLTEKKLAYERAAERPVAEYREWMSQMEAVNRRIKTLKLQIEETTRSESDQQTRIEEIRVSQESLNKELESAKKQAAKVGSEKNNLSKRIEASEEQVQQSKRNSDKIHQSWTELQDKFAKSKSYNVKQKLESSISKHVNNGQLPGYLGNLWDISIPEKYGPAFAANGANSDIFLTDSTTAAEAIIRIAREERLGRANCLVLPQVQKRYLNNFKEVVNNRKGIPRDAVLLIDCIKDRVDETRLLAVFSKITDTLVAEDMDAARRLAFKENKRYRVVTLAGEIIEKNGVMSGGHSRLLPRGATCETVDAEKVEQANISYREADGAYRKAKEAHLALMKQMNHMMETENATSTKINNIETEIINRSDELKTILNLQKTGNSKQLIEASLAKSNAELKKEESAKSKLSEQEQPLKTAAEKAEKVVSDANTEIENFGGVEIQELKSKMSELSGQLEQVQRQIASEEGELKKVKVQVQDHLNTRIPLEEKKKKTQEDNLAEYEKEREKNENEGFTIVQTQEKARKMIDDIDRKLSEITKNLTDIQQKNEETHHKNAEFKKELDLYMVKQKEATVEVAKMTAESKKLQKQWRSLPDLDKIAQMISMKKGEVPFNVDDNVLPIEDEEKSSLSKDMVDLSVEATISLLEAIHDADVEIFDGLDDDLVQVQMEKAKVTLAGMNTINYSIFKTFEDNHREYTTRLETHQTHFNSHTNLENTLNDLESKRYREFNNGFTTISCRLKELYQMITFGGDAELEYKNAEKPFEEGIIFSVRPPKKSWKAISNLSGGEKTLSSLSLIFALHFYRPSPIYFLDEIDAALDFRNVAIISHTVALRTKDTQFTIISLRNQMFEKADRLIGTFKRNDLTDVIIIDPKVISGEEDDQQLMITN